MSQSQLRQRRARLAAKGANWEYDPRFDPDPKVAAKAIEAEMEEQRKKASGQTQERPDEPGE